MTSAAMQRSVTAASAIGCLLSTSPGYAQSVAAATKEPTLTVQVQPRAAAEDTTIRPFRVNIPDQDLAELRRRIAATRWPEKETVADQSQGVPLSMMRELASYWGTKYDWRKGERAAGNEGAAGRLPDRGR
jgi:hypothetical protein